MNCKPGDLAVRIAGPEGAYIKVGHVMVVLELIGGSSICARTGKFWDEGSVWLVEINGRRIAPDGNPFGVPDMYLRPIRDNDGEDETLQWAPVPEKEIA